jgi:hypothetical protein
VSRPRAVPASPPVEIDEVALAARYRSLSIWCQLHVDGEGVHIRESGTPVERLEHIEREIDRNGIRVQADRHLASLQRGVERTRAHIATLRAGGYA